MIKTIAMAAFGIFISTATPALASSSPLSPPVVTEINNVNGLRWRGIAVHGAAQQGTQPSILEQQTTVQTMRSATAPARDTLPVPLDAEGGNKPVQVACLNGCGGILFNGVFHNGLKWNGLVLNGWTLNGIVLNGWSMNGLTLNGRTLNGTGTGAVAERVDTELTVTAVTLPGGTRLAVND